MSLIKYHTKCRICSGSLEPILFLGYHFLHGSFKFKGYNPPERRVPVQLTKCSNRNCNLVQLEHSIDPSILYEKYGYRSSLSEIMKNHLKGTVEEVLSIKPDIKTVLSIGANDCYSISCFSKDVQKYVVDPCDIVTKVNIENLTVFNETYPCYSLNAPSRDGFFDYIEMFACLYDCDKPLEVAKSIAYNLSLNGLANVEVSLWPDKMAKNAFDEVCNEHVVFFSFSNLENIFQQAGLKVIKATKTDINGGSIRLLLAHKSNLSFDNQRWFNDVQSIRKDEFEKALDTDAPYYKFNHNVMSLKDKVKAFFSENKDKKFHLLAASTKGNVALQFFELDSKTIPYCSERNKDKFGGSTLGTNILMISEEESRAMNPDFYLVTNWAFRSQIVDREQEYLKKGGKLLFLIPEIEIVEFDNNTQKLVSYKWESK